MPSCRPVKHLITFLRENKVWWVTPIVVVLALLGILLYLARQNAASTPFVYNLF